MQLQLDYLSHNIGSLKGTKKLHWVAKTGREARLTLREYDQLITKAKVEEEDNFEDFVNRDSLFDTVAIGEPGLGDLSVGQVVQLERMGFYIVDKNASWQGNKEAPILIKIPDGKAKAMSAHIVGKVDVKKLQGANDKGGKTAAAGDGERPPGVPAPDADPKFLKELEETTELVKSLKADGGKPGDAVFDGALTKMKELKEKCGIREPTKAERKAMDKAAKAKGK